MEYKIDSTSIFERLLRKWFFEFSAQINEAYEDPYEIHKRVLYA